MLKQIIPVVLITSWQVSCVRQKDAPLNTRNPAASETDKKASETRQQINKEVLALVEDIKSLNAMATPDALTLKSSTAKVTPEGMQQLVDSDLFDETMKKISETQAQQTGVALANTEPEASGENSDALAAGAAMMIFAGFIDMVPGIGNFYNATGHGSSANRWTAANVGHHGSNIALNMANIVVGSIILSYSDEEIPKELVYTSAALLLVDAVFTLNAGFTYAKEAYDIAKGTVSGTVSADKKNTVIFVKESRTRTVGGVLGMEVQDDMLSPMSKSYEWDRRLDSWSKKYQELKSKWSNDIAQVHGDLEANGKPLGKVAPMAEAVPVKGASAPLPIHGLKFRPEFDTDGKTMKAAYAMINGVEHRFERIVDNSGVEKFKSDIEIKELSELMPVVNKRGLYVGAGLTALVAAVSTTFGAIELSSSIGHVSEDFSLAKRTPKMILQDIDQRARRIYQLKTAR